jgi:hypothetical protein
MKEMENNMSTSTPDAPKQVSYMDLSEMGIKLVSTPPEAEKKSYREAMKEAENAPTLFDPKERAEMIRRMIKEIPKMIREGKTEEEIRAAEPEFCEKYPQILKTMLKGDDMTLIHGMLKMLDEMAKGKVTQHQASMAVGQHLFNKFGKGSVKDKGHKK